MAELSRLPLVLVEAWSWQFDGACRDADPRLFFHPEGERGPARIKRDALALSYCAKCPVIDECRKHGLSTREPFGVWGGLTEDQRLQMHRHHRHQLQERPKTAS